MSLGISLAAIATGLMGGTAVAQEADTTAQEEEIVVTGFRRSLAQAIDIKRTEVGAVDAIVAEDIADFPDANLSESIQRIPGVSITRSAGEGRNISVRGLGPQFTRVRINGMEAMSAVGSTDAEGGTNRSRGFDFNIFASELFNNITVRKTSAAETEEGSLGATIDLRTARPFDYRDFTLAISGQTAYGDAGESWDPRVAILASNTWLDGSLGALVSVAYSERQLLEEGASTVRWQRSGAPSTCVTGAGPNFGLGGACFGNVLGQTEDTPAVSRGDFDAVNGAFHPRIPRYDIYENDSQRLGATVALQWRPTDRTTASFDMLYAEHNATRSEAFLESPVFSTNGASAINAVDVLDYEVQGGTLVYGLFNDVDIRSELRQDQLDTIFRQYSLLVEHDFTDSLRASVFVGSSEADHDNPIQTTLLWDRNDVDGYSYDFRGNNRLPLITYGGLNVADPAVWSLSQIRLRPQFVTNTFETAYGDIEYDVSDAFTVRAGLNWKQYEFDSIELRRSNGTNSNIEGVRPAFTTATPTSNYARLVTIDGSGLNLPAGLTRSWVVPDIDAAAALWGLYDTSIFQLGIEPSLGNNATIEEEDNGWYVQGDLDTDIAGMRLRGNLGVRYVETNQTASGYTYSGGAVRQTVNRSYDDTLPALNLAFEPMDDFLIRFGAAKVMTRPNLGNLNPGAVVSVSGNNKTVTAGNPDLEPFRATTYDLSFEWYFQEEGLLSVAFFYKDIDSFVQTVRSTGVFTGNSLGLPDSVAISACASAPPGTCSPSDTDWQYSLPRNTPGGPLEGYEVSLQLPFFFFDGFLSNFGILANYTNVSSDIDYVGVTGAVVATAPLTGLSEEAWNATFYYEDERLSARVSGAYRSDYITTIPGRNEHISESTASTFNVDFSSSYQLVEGLRLTFEGLNLSDEVNDQFLSPDDRLSFYHHYGRTFMAGFRYTY